MRSDLTPWVKAQAELLLSAVKTFGSLRRAAQSLGMPYSTARDRWHKWDLSKDRRLVRRPAQSGSEPIFVALPARIVTIKTLDKSES